MTTDQNSECFQWTWKNSLDRIQYIDTIIAQIVSGAVLFNSALLAVFGSLCYIFYTSGLPNESKMIVRKAMLIVSLLVFSINLILALILSRQEYIRQWYFHIIPDNIPLTPHEKWLEREITSDIKDYDMKPKPASIKQCGSRINICRVGKWWRGYCESWMIILIILAFSGILLMIISWNII